jgi:hypothetical protein
MGYQKGSPALIQIEREGLLMVQGVSKEKRFSINVSWKILRR